ncbi:MAG: HPr family phosphocarrier protein [Planctomycetota bacterium]|nr:HPr family phosphocarrier protein [Planctomycetota bacterium]
METHSAEARVLGKYGLHARSLIALERLARAFDKRCELQIWFDGRSADPRDALRVRETLGPIEYDQVVRIEGSGPDAESAVNKLKAFIEDRCGELE